MNKKIFSKDISIIVQGAVDNNITKICLDNIRKLLPDSEIILSTWKNQNLKNLNYDILIENDDPGAILRNDFLKIPHNLNRQLISTQSGLKRASRKYAMKFRTDLILHSCEFLKYFGKYTKSDKEYTFLNQRVIICDIFTRNPNILRPYPFCLSAWVYFGLKEDLLVVWDIPPANETEYSRWFENHPRPIPDYYPDDLCRISAEQYICTEFVKKFMDINLEHSWDTSSNNRELSDKILANNAIVLELPKWSIETIKYKKLRAVDWVSLYNHNQWELLYKKYCDPDYFVLPSIKTLYKYYLLKSNKVRGIDVKTLQERKQFNLLFEEVKQLRKELKDLTEKIERRF